MTAIDTTATPRDTSAPARVDRTRVAVMTLAHGVNDSYGNCLQTLLPSLTASLGFSLSLAGGMVTAYSITNGFIQPVLGYVADRWATRFMSVVGLAMTATGTALLGLAPHWTVLMVLALLGGLGTAIYHPQAAAMVVAVSGPRRATMMSVYLMGGNIGLALGPFFVALLTDHRGLAATWLLIFPGLMGALMLVQFAPRDWNPAATGRGPGLLSVLKANRSLLVRLFAVVTTRSWAHYTLLALLPFYLKDKGLGETERGLIITLITLAGAFGGVVGGYLADRVMSRRTVIAGSLALSSLFVVPLLYVDGWVRLPFAVLTGATLLGSFAVLTVKGQEIMPQNVGLASGFMLGLTISLGGLFVLPMAWIADNVTGIGPMLNVAIVLPLAAAALALTLPE